MSGHNKWSKIKHVKERVDAKRGKAFTRCNREIVVAAREGGGDPAFNPGLRLAIDRAKAVNMPATNIDRAIKKGTGELEGETYEEVIYEGYGPAGSAVYIRTLTDNRNRTVAELRNLFNKAGGNLGDSGAVSWMFEKKGVFRFEDLTQNEEEMLELAMEAGCDDIEVNGDMAVAYCAPDQYGVVRDAWEALGVSPVASALEFLPQNPVTVSPEEEEKIDRFLNHLDDQDDTQEVFVNVEFVALEA